MHSTTTIIDQREIPGEPCSAVVRHYSLRALAELQTDVRAAIPSSPPFAVGVSVGLAPVGPRIETIALATRDKVFCLSMPQSPSPTQRKALQELFSNIQYLTGFEFPYTIVLLAHTLGSTVTGYDLSTLSSPSRHNDITTPGNFLNSNNPSVSARRINERWDGDVLRSRANPDGTPEPDYALRAWFTAISANMAFSDLLSGQKLSTVFIDVPVLQSFVDLVSRVTRLELSKPRVYENEFSKVQTESDGSITVLNTRYKTRIRDSKQTHLEIRLDNGDVVDAMIKGAKGRSSSARTERPLRGDVSHIRVIGREERTNAEQAQYRLLIRSLTVAHRIPPFVNIIWFPGNIEGIEHDGETTLSCGHSFQILKGLNDSQRGIVHAMLSTASRDSLVIAHGPPGTGKTTTIAAAAAIWVSNKLPCWIIAQSNVGVKNIAEKLFKKKISFKLIVSKDFLFEWHEELYVEIENMIIRSDEIPNSPSAVSRLFIDVTVVLCTLGMLSNPKLHDCGLFRIIPVRSLVIDEASQIDVFEFMHLFDKFSDVLTKVCFFGDPKQLPPYGAQKANLETIFDVKHLKKTAYSYFLDTQYRLPVPLGEFISTRVYDGKLRSSHGIVDRSCISFIDVWKGGETKDGTSFKNMEEAHMVVRIAKRYQRHGFNFCIITFYDLQRAAIAKAMEVANLPTGRVYNVDSFQGNEADYVILSSVRTERAGFLNSQPRMNVALTRCRKGMVVVTDKCFLQGAGRNTLLGQLCRAWTQHRDTWIDWKDMLSDSVALPGLPTSLLSNSSSRAALASTSASISQWPPVQTSTANTDTDKRWNTAQYPDPSIASWRRGPPQPPMADSTRADEPFPPTPSTPRHTGTGAFDETPHLGRIAAASRIPHEKQAPISKLTAANLRIDAEWAAHRSGDWDAPTSNRRQHEQQQQRREAPVLTTTSTSRPNQRHSESEAGVEAAHVSWRRTAQGPLCPLAAESSESWRRSIKALQVSTPAPAPAPTPMPPPVPAPARARAHAATPAPAPAPARAPAPAHSLAPAPLPARTPVAHTYPLAPAPSPARDRARAHPLAPAPPPARDRAYAPTPVYTRVPAPAPPPVPTPAPASTPAHTTNTDTAGGFASLLTQPLISALGWIFGS